jgi:hypothetical protein
LSKLATAVIRIVASMKRATPAQDFSPGTNVPRRRIWSGAQQTNVFTGLRHRTATKRMAHILLQADFPNLRSSV